MQLRPFSKCCVSELPVSGACSRVQFQVKPIQRIKRNDANSCPFRSGLAVNEKSTQQVYLWINRVMLAGRFNIPGSLSGTELLPSHSHCGFSPVTRMAKTSRRNRFKGFSWEVLK